MRGRTLVIIGIFTLLATLIWGSTVYRQPPSEMVHPNSSPAPLWAVRSIDAMKYSRDLAREKANNSSFDATIEAQVAAIADTGASHIALATPYDPEFVPFLTRWVAAARAHHLHVWFRGNAAGWEQWFDYPKITREQHEQVIVNFIKSNGGLFANGDIFTPCPECENGGDGDPRAGGDLAAYRQFLIDEYRLSSQAFRDIGKNVEVGYYSMNYDVANLVMDPATTEALGGVVAIDHYVESPDRLVSDIKKLSAQTGGKIYLAEWGAPIPDIHGDMTPEQQAAWIKQAFTLFRDTPQLIGLNYWVNVGGSTEIWSDPKVDTPAAAVIRTYYSRLEIPQ